MTAIAYRDGVMAADTLVSAGTSVTGQMIKVRKIKGWLAGASGNAASMAQFFKWVEDGMDADVAKVENFSGLLVNPKGKVFQVEDELFPYEVVSEFHATGSAHEFLKGAMAMGASPEQAVELAKEHDTGCGGDTTVVRL